MPYSKLKAIRDNYCNRLLAIRDARVVPTPLPPATIFVGNPTPSYVLSPQFAARLPKQTLSSLASNLVVYEKVFTGNEGFMVVEEQDCTPEVLIDRELQGEQAAYYGHGQIHVLGVLDMFRAGVKGEAQFASAWRLSERLRTATTARLHREGLPVGSESLHENDAFSVFCETDQGRRDIARISAEVDHSSDIATVSVTMNFAVPVPGVDPERTDPYARLTTPEVRGGRFTSCVALSGMPVAETWRPRYLVGWEDLWTYYLLDAMRWTFGTVPSWKQEWVGHARALGESDPDLQG